MENTKKVEDNSTQQTNLYLGQIFNSDNDLHAALEAYSKQNNQLFVTSKSYTYEQLQLKKIKNPTITYHSLIKECKYGPNRVSEATGKRSASTFKKNCQAFIQFAGIKEKYYSLSALNLDHTNHEGLEKYYDHLPENRRLNSEEKDEVRFLHSLKSQTSKIHQHMLNKTKKKIVPQAIYNAINETKIENGNNIEATVNLLKEKYNASVQILEEDNQFLGMFFTTPKMKEEMNKFPEVVCADCTYKIFNLRFSLMLFIIEDGDGRTQFVGVAILVNESRPVVKWAMESFKKDHLEAVKRIRGFVTDKDMTERSVIAEVFFWVRLFICQFHALRIFGREVCLTEMPINKEEKENALRCLDRMVKSSCQADYDQAEQALMSTAPTVIKDYFIKNWQNITEEWVQFKIFKLNLKNLTNNRIESLNGKLKNEIGIYNSLMGFTVKLFTWIDYRFECMLLKDVHKKLKINPNEIDKSDFGKARSLYKENLTDFAYRVVLKQIQYFECLTLQNLDVVAETATATHCKEEMYVTPYSCTCFDMYSMGLPRRHMLAIRLALNMPLFSEDICLDRWKRDSDESIDFNNSYSNTSCSYIVAPKKNIEARMSSPTKKVNNKSKMENDKQLTYMQTPVNNNNVTKFTKKQTSRAEITKLVTPKSLRRGDKRRKLKQTMDDLTEVIVEQCDEVFMSRLDTLKEILQNFKDNKDVTTIPKNNPIVNSEQSSLEDSIEHLSLQESNISVNQIQMPTPMKRRGKVRGVQSCTIKLNKKNKVGTCKQCNNRTEKLVCFYFELHKFFFYFPNFLISRVVNACATVLLREWLILFELR